MEYPAHDLPVTGLGFAPTEAGAKLGGYDLLAGSADYKITLFKSQGESAAEAVARCPDVCAQSAVHQNSPLGLSRFEQYHSSKWSPLGWVRVG